MVTFDPASYGGNAETALKVRQAFLLSIPRNEIIEEANQTTEPNPRLRTAVTVRPWFRGYDEAKSYYAQYLGTDGRTVRRHRRFLLTPGILPIDVGFWFPQGNVRRGQS